MKRVLVIALSFSAVPALAGPPYVTDDAEPTDLGLFEIYAFTGGTTARDGTSGAGGIDFNYGGARDLQLTAVVPFEYDGPGRTGIGNIELAAKYRFLHQDDFGWDVAVFPRVFLPSASRDAGDKHGSFLLPIWVEKDFGKWSAFGGGGCALNNGDGGRNYCLEGWVVTRELTPALHLGVEVYHQSAGTRGGRETTGLGFGATYDLSENYHLMASAGPGIENAAGTDRATWYVAMLFTF
jgi:hypothetical protein